jgi:glucosylceramidase
MSTTIDQRNKLTPQRNVTFSNDASLHPTLISVDEHMTYQKIVGFGASFNGSTVWELENKLTQTQRDALMQKFFDPTNGIGISILRQPIGASDQDAPEETAPNQYCSYDDHGGIPDDANLSHFSIAHDISTHTIDLIHQAMHLNPQLKILATTWCTPQWMLTGYGNSSMLNPAYYASYATYLIKFIQAYAEQRPAIPIWGITLQNEPVYSYANFGDNLTADQENTFIKNDLGPAFANNGITSKVLAYDHNWDHPEYAERILDSSSQYVAGTSWHSYKGDVDAQSTVHNLYPDEGIFFTEDSPPTYNTDWNRYMPEETNRIIDILRNWSQTYIQWTMVLNPQFGPGSCTNCGADAYIDENTRAIMYSSSYYLLGHFSKYVKPNAYRIDSTDLGKGSIRSIAFKNPDGSKVLIVYNDSFSNQTLGVNWRGEHFSYSLPSKAIATFTWSGTDSF